MKDFLRAVRASTWLRVVVLGCAAGALSYPMTVGAAFLAAVFGAAVAAIAADRIAAADTRPRLRTAAVWLGAVAVVVLGGFWSRVLSGSAGFADAVGPVAAIQIAEALLWGLTLAPVLFAVRFTARRHPTFELVEVALAAGAFASAFAAHRRGMIHRPYAIGDEIWQWGVDPTLVFLILGGAFAALLAVFLLADERLRRIPMHLGVLVAVALLVTALVRLDALPRPDPPGSGKPQEEEQEQGARGGEASEGGEGESKGARSRDDDWDFRNDSEDLDESPVAVVVFHDDYDPNSGAYYFRQAALSQYNGRRLVKATRDDVDRDVIRHFPADRVVVPGAQEDLSERQPVRTTTGLLIEHISPFALDAPQWFEPAGRASARFQRAYAALSSVQTTAYGDMLGLTAGREDWTPEQWAHYTRAPADPRYRELARKLREGLREELRDDPLALAIAVKLYLDENGYYSLKSRHADDEDPTASFLFGDLVGYCVHFSHASAFLLRSLGVPTRVGTGYMVPERHGYGGSAVLIRSMNAHAWPEIYVEGVGWIVVDLSPEQSDLDQVPPVDPELQQMLGDLLRDELVAEGSPDALNKKKTLQTAFAILVAAALLAIATGYAVRIQRAVAARLAGPTDSPRVVYRAALDALSSVGLWRSRGESRERFATRAEGVAPSLQPLTAAHLRWALGPTGSADPDALRSLARRLRTEVRGSIPAWRRWLGAIDPFCWWRVR